MSSQKHGRPRAVSKEGKIGKVSCYVLDDGRCVLSEHGVVVELSGDPSNKNSLGRYLARLASKSDDLAVLPSFEFTLPGGGVAKAIMDDDFMADELDRELKSITRAIVYIAHRSGHNIEYFWVQVAELLGVAPIQMDLPLPATGRATEIN